MKILSILMLGIFLLPSCSRKIDKEAMKKEIFETEKAFEKMAAHKGAAKAFYFYADENAVIHRENDTLITGKENVRIYYEKKNAANAVVNWTPDFVEVSDCCTLGYTYGKFVWKVKDANGKPTEYKGTFHTVWKKQKDKSWKFVWD